MRDKIYQKEREQSKWIQALEKEKEQRETKEEQERAARRARLAKLFDEDEHFEEDRLDAGAADQGLNDYLGKIDTHLEVEKKILQAWGENDTGLKVEEKEKVTEAEQTPEIND